jgi:hypothetical protein
MTSATCGLVGFLSSPSAALQQSLENRLKRQLDGVGSTLFSPIWKAKATPAGRPYSQLVASGRRISDNDFGSWPTPGASGFEVQDMERLKQRREECKERTGNGNGFGLTLGQAALLWCSWPHQALGAIATGSPAQTEKRGQLSPDHSRWLMGYSAEHLSCAPTAMRSSRKSRQNS